MNGLLPYQIKTSRDNLLYVGRMSIKSVIDRSCFETLHDRAPEVINFCNILEHILSFCTKNASRSIFSVDNKRHPWLFIRDTCRTLPDSCVSTIETMENLKGHYAKLRGWIKLALLQKRLAEYLQYAVQQTPTVLKYFDPRSLVRSPELNVYLNTLMGLTAVDFSFDLRGEDQVHPGLMCIDYTPYLRFTPSDESLLDDALECDEHLDLNSKCPWQERFLKLELKYKREAQQKHFLEERVRNLDALMMSREVEREQFETEMRQMESVILELQVQITLLQEQYRDELLKLGGNPDAVPNVPAARGHTRTLPPSMVTHRLAPVEPTRRPLVGHQQFVGGRRYSSPQTRSRENLALRLTPIAQPGATATTGREVAFEALDDSEMWSEEDLERRKMKVPVILFPEDEPDTTPERESNESISETAACSSMTQGQEDINSSIPLTPDIVRRLREGEGKSASGYYRLMATPADESNAASLIENSRREFFDLSMRREPEPGKQETDQSDVVASGVDETGRQPGVSEQNPNGDDPNVPSQQKEMGRDSDVPSQQEEMGRDTNVPEEEKEMERDADVESQQKEMGRDGDVPDAQEETGRDADIPEQQEEMGRDADVPESDKEMGRDADVLEEEKEMGRDGNVPGQQEEMGRDTDVPEQQEEMGRDANVPRQEQPSVRVEVSEPSNDAGLDSEVVQEQVGVRESDVMEQGNDLFRDSNGNGEITGHSLDSNGNGEITEPVKELIDSDDVTTVRDSNDNGDFLPQTVRTVRDSNDNDGGSTSITLNGTQVS